MRAQMVQCSDTHEHSSVLTQPGQLQAVFKDSDKHSKAPANNSGFYMSQLLGQCVGLISGPDWRATRTVTETPFRHSAVALQIEAFQRRIEEHFDELHTAVEGGRGNLERGLLHPVDDLSLLPFRIVTDMFYGRLPRPLRAQLEALIPLRMRIFTEHVIRGGGLHRFAWARVLPTTANADLRRFKREWKAFNAAALDECTRRALAYAKQGGGADDDDEGGRGSGACAPPPPVMGMFAAVAAGIITEEQLLQTLDESLFANLDVTVGGLSWVPVFLAAHPAAQRRLRDEIAREGGATGDRMRRYLLDGRSTFLSACVLESSRLRPLAAFSVPQAAPTPRWVEAKNGGAAGGGGGEGGRGYMIPAGTSFVVDTYALNVRNEAWAPDNEAFRPDRFLEGTDKDARDRRYLFWRFGFGPRQCMGRHAADLMLRMVVAHIVRNYHLDMLPGDKAAWERSRESWITHPNFKLQCVQIEED